MKKILIIEDEQDIVKTIKMSLEMAGYEILAAGDGIEGLEKARSGGPDLIILDLMLPKLDGYRVARMLKFDEKHKSIPIIVLTARAQEEDKKLAKEAGVDVFITKPFDLEFLLKKIKEFIGD